MWELDVQSQYTERMKQVPAYCDWNKFNEWNKSYMASTHITTHPVHRQSNWQNNRYLCSKRCKSAHGDHYNWTKCARQRINLSADAPEKKHIQMWVSVRVGWSPSCRLWIRPFFYKHIELNRSKWIYPGCGKRCLSSCMISSARHLHGLILHGRRSLHRSKSIGR